MICKNENDKLYIEIDARLEWLKFEGWGGREGYEVVMIAGILNDFWGYGR